MSNEFDNAIEAGSGSGETWKPETEGDLIFGTYKAHKSSVGQNNSEVYLIQEDDKDEPTNVWGSTVLDARFEEIPVGSRVQITYLGKKTGKRAEYKDYLVKYVANEDAAKVQKAVGGEVEDVS